MWDMFTRELERSFSEFPPAIATVRLVAAILLGGLIGFEREQRGKSAGLRTHMLVAMAACLFILVSQSLGTLHFGDRAELRVDPLRLVEAVTAGVAFLGAGAIFSSGGQVHNITTGAGMWMAGAIGLWVRMMETRIASRIASVGFVDDYLKISNQRSLGLGGWAKVAGQLIVSVVFSVLVLTIPAGSTGMPLADPVISGVRDIPWLDLAPLGALGIILFVLWITVINVSAANAVNVTDGLDGLATGSMILSMVGYVFIAFWQFNQSCLSELPPGDAARCYDVAQPLDIATLAATVMGALIGFLWWNTSPAQIFMGDVGSLALGGALAGFAVMTDTQLLLIVIAGLPIIVTGSVIVQRAYFKATGGKRVFLMTPLHHHFELKGWAEVTIVVRFWIITGLFVAAAVGAFYFEWTVHPR